MVDLVSRIRICRQNRSIKHSADRSFSETTQLHDALCQKICVTIEIGIEPSEQIVERYELRSTNVPMRMARLKPEVEALREADIQ